MTRFTDRQPTLCHVLHTMHVGGAEMLAAEYARRSCQEFRVLFACLDDLGELGARLRDEGFVVEVIGRRPGFDLGCARRLAKLFAKHDVDVVHAHQYGPFFYSSLSRLFRHGTPILFQEHGRDYPDYPRPKRKWANRVLLRPRDRVVAVGQCVRQALVENEGLDANRVEVVYNGVDLRRYELAKNERASVREELGLASDQTLIIQVARLNRLKDHGTALRAMARLVERQPRAKLVLVGDGEERPAIERLIDSLQLVPFVTLMGSRNDVPRLLQGADIFLLSSITEGIPLTLIEAMATGLPILATAVGGNPEVVVDGATGFLVPAGNDAEMADRLERLVRSPDRAREWGIAGSHRSAERFGDTQMHAAYRSIYREMLNGHPRGACSTTYTSSGASSR